MHREVLVDLVDAKGAVGEAVAEGTDLDSAEGAKAVVEKVVAVMVMMVIRYLSDPKEEEEGLEE